MSYSEYKHGLYKIVGNVGTYWCHNCQEWIFAVNVGSPTHQHWFNDDKGFICNVGVLRFKEELAKQELRESAKNLGTHPIAAKPIEVDEILKERGKRYATFIDNAKVSQALKAEIWSSENWIGEKLNADQKEALELIALKISRILTGDPDYVDNWDDIAGYAILVSKRLKGELL